MMWAFPDRSASAEDESGNGSRRRIMHSIFWLIGVIVVVLVILSLLGVR